MLLGAVGTSILLYGAPVWAEALLVPSYARLAQSAYRQAAIRVCSAYRTISADAVLVIAGLPPLELLAGERRAQYNRVHGSEEDPSDSRRDREKTLEVWQQQWDCSTNGRWTHRLIPNVKAWALRGHGEVNFYLTQMLSGHGGFREYLVRIGVETTAECPTCIEQAESAEHVLLECVRFNKEREELQQTMETPLTVESFVSSMLQSKSKWVAGCQYAAAVMKTLRKEEDARQRRRRSRRGE